ncbi:class I SAM-dependent methyltransferase [Aquabacterium olei]|jgi:ubiquinone/menaquinone biosynthesis C-methylase UbiE|nr:class I SAM-dependent methyltransferase [Aquabacterium olei]
MTAVDRCPEMIRSVWPADHVPTTFRVTQAEWTALPLANHAVDAVIGDGITTVLPRWEEIDTVLSEVHRVLRPGGLALMRLFVKPVDSESPDQLLKSLLCGPTLGFHSFKLRLLMALQPSLSAGVAPRDAYRWWKDLEATHPEALVRHAWTQDQRHTISFYEASPDRYWFPTEAELTRSFVKYFTVKEVIYSSYESADRCPLFVLHRKN